MLKSSTRVAALSLALACLAVCAVRADVRELVNQGKVTWAGSPTVIYLNADGTPATAAAYDHLVLKFTDTSAAGSLTIGDTVRANARVLVVGGGGAGGTSKTTTTGCGGGGGAGGLVDTTQTLVGGTYAIVVGAGGSMYTGGADIAVGENGADSSFASIVAYGGGGGGAQSVGNNGGSGGGGSRSPSSTNLAGGNGENGQGKKGGAGKTNKYGGGGGGAGYEGGNTSAADGPGTGGNGVTSDILLDELGQAIYYAGGGSGGSAVADMTSNPGKGGGGRGASKGDDAAGNGTDGLGGGGGGGGNACVGGKGGNGVIIVRITDANEVKVDVPVINDFTYTGDNILVSWGIAYEYVNGTTNATSTGNYSFSVKPATDFEWKDNGGSEPREVSWKIVKRLIEKPTVVTGFVYDGTDKIGVTYSEDCAKYCTFSASSVTNATNGGTYTYSVSLSDPANTAWADNSTGPVEGSWTIVPAQVVRPIPNTGLYYDGTEQVGFSTLDWTRYELTAGETNATAGGVHQFTFELLGNNGAINYVWDTDPASADPYSGEWTISAAANAITGLSLKGWRIGTEPNTPVLAATWGADTVVYEYGFGVSESSVSTWLTDPTQITESGNWIVRATIPATDSWASAKATAMFDMWDDPGKLYDYHVDIFVKGASVLMTNFPVAVRISEERMLGFDYGQADSKGQELAFIDTEGNLLPYEVDTWNTSGESIVWVRLASLPTTGATITMFWGLGEGKVALEYTPTVVWNEYAGVWHMNETIASGVAATTPSKDSTAYQNNAMPKKGNSGQANLAQMVSTPGAIGNGRINGSSACVQGGNKLETTKTLTFDGVFTFSGWFKMNARSNYPRFAGTKAGGANADGWSVESMVNSSSGLYVRGNGGTQFSDVPVDDMLNTWVYLTFVYNNTSASVYSNGKHKKTGTITKVKDTTQRLTFGAQGSSEEWSLYGSYDEIRIAKGVLSADRIDAEYKVVADENFTRTNSPVYHGENKINLWLELPALDKTSWDANETPGTFVSEGKLLYGDVTNIIYSVYTGETFANLSEITSTGLYRIDFLPTLTDGYEPISYTIDIHVVESQPYTKIAGNNGDSGRVLLMNRDTNTGLPKSERCPIENQSDDVTGKARPTFWQFVNKDGSGLSYNLRLGTETILWKSQYSERLWHLIDCRHGNSNPAGAKGVKDVNGKIIPANYTKTPVLLNENQNYLPYSTTSYDVADEDTKANPSTAGQVVMRNTVGATVYSSCFINGIGTIYFDAVNGWLSENGNYDNYKLVVEIATNTIYGLEPTDANSIAINTVTNVVEGEDVITVTTNFYGNLEGQWIAAEMIPFKRDGTPDFVEESKTSELALSVANGGTMDNFYRVVVPLDIAGPVRFRIRRTTCLPVSDFQIDEGGFILLDNIIASIPAMRGDLISAGHYEAEKNGSQVLGWELSTSVPYPSTKDEELFVHATPIYTLNVGDGSTPDTSTFFSSATMHYRWRYLNQTLTQQASKWKTVDLNPGAGFKAIAPLDLPEGRVGDVEYWFEYRLQAPFYKYVDYSGASNASINYTEDRGTLTNKRQGETLPSGGTDWFFRLREGKSDNAGLDIVFSRGNSGIWERVPMALGEDHVWRGFVQTKENQTGVIKYRIESIDNRTESYTDYVATTNYWSCRTDNPPFPVSDSLEATTVDGWSTLTLDAVTGYVMFQIDDASMALTVVHADYQNANGWSDALGRKDSQNRGPIFVGTSTTNSYKIGVSPSKQTFEDDFSGWGTMSATNATWTFPTGLDDIKPNHMYGRKSYETFASETNGLWDVGQGMWIAKKYRDDRNNAGVALQMGGYGKGYLQFTDSSKAPRGLESVSFNARLTQDIQFDDFAYYFGGTEGMLNLQNYTFMARTAFDRNSNKDFTGNASLSVVAYYLPNKGCYEARWEWLGNNNNAKRGQRLCLYRWNVIKGVKESELIVAKTNTVVDINGVTAFANSDTHKFFPLFISVSNDVPNNCTWVAAGIRRAGTKLGDSPLSQAASATWLGVCFKDTDSTRLTRGSYGVLSANCPGILARPEFSHTVQIVTPGANKTRDTYENSNLPQVENLQNIVNCAARDLNDADWPGWNIIPERNVVEFSSGSPSYGAVVGSAPAQDLQIFLGTAGRSDWGSTPYKTINVDSFGGDTFDIPLYTTRDCSVRFAVGNGISDIAVDSVVLRQWRGGDWNAADVHAEGIAPSWTTAADTKLSPAYTNFIFTSCWTVESNILMSAKRSNLQTPCSIRSPLMDGYANDGRGGDGYRRGIGLGMVSIGYKNAQENASLLLQIATNNVDWSMTDTFDKSFSEGYWTTVTNFNFALEPLRSHRTSGVLNTYLGLHSVTGMVRIIVNTNVIAMVANEMNTSRFGDVTITSIVASDEPPVDVHSWWGWNLRTIGGDKDSERMMYLSDFETYAGSAGLSIALNNSVDPNYVISRIDVADRESYIQHKPFVQTPTFTSNIVGEVSFKARKYSASDTTATVVLFGSKNASENDDGTWERIDAAVFSVTNDWYETYSYKTDPGQNFKAFRLAVVGVEGVTDSSGGGNGGLPDDGRRPERVLLDELYVSEAVRARIGFKNVGCFKSNMGGTDMVPNVPSRREQPLCGEAWGVQCEIYGAQLASDIDFEHTPRVRLHWFDTGSGVVAGGWSPWGYDNWKDQGSRHKSAWLVPATGVEEGRYVYRSSLLKSPESVISMSTHAPTYVQYMLEVVFYTKGSTVPVTNFLSRAEWGENGRGPEWYRPLDLNAQYGAASGSFAAYNILDNVAPGWAWINEVNVFGLYDDALNNTDADCQFVEIAQPPEADLTGWSLRILEAQTGNDLVATNTLATFGPDLDGTKDAKWIDPQANMVFRVIANRQAQTSGKLKRSDGTLDGIWKLENIDLTNMSGDPTGDTTVNPTRPFGLQLVRSSGIVEHEIVAMGTNWWSDLSIIYQRMYGPTNAVDFLNMKNPDSRFFYVGMDDDGGETKSLGVFQNNGMTNDWNNTMVKTPGRRNENQYIDPDHPVPSGESLLVYFTVSGDNILQWDGESFTNGLIMTLVEKGSKRGTNITYRVSPWYEVNLVTTNAVSAMGNLVQTTPGNTQPRVYTLEGVGKGASNNVVVVAYAGPDSRLAAQYDVDEDNPYRPAIIDWLNGGTDLYGNPFADNVAGDIKLAEFRTMNNTFVTNMTLTEMYWLDMDPTVGNLALLGGMAEAPTSRTVDIPGGGSRTYLRMGVYMMITNGNEGASVPEYPRGPNDFGSHWTPYALRGLEPGENSLGYEQEEKDWNSVTFKLTGLLLNGKTNPKVVDYWMPLRWFVFREDSFTAEGLSRIEIEDPHSPDSIGYNTGWGRWWEENGFTDPVYFWSIDTRLQPIGIEPLKQENYYGN